MKRMTVATTALATWIYCEDEKRENKIEWGMNFKPGFKVRRMRVEQNSIRGSRSAQCSG